MFEVVVCGDGIGEELVLLSTEGPLHSLSDEDDIESLGRCVCFLPQKYSITCRREKTLWPYKQQAHSHIGNRLVSFYANCCM